MAQHSSESSADGEDGVSTADGGSIHPVRSLLILTLSFTLVFTAFLSLEGIQSSINFEAGMGTVSMGLLYACFFSTNLFLGPLIVQLVGPKWTLLGGWIVHTLFICVNFYPSWYTMLPVSAMLGVASSPIWIAHGVFLSVLSQQHAKASNQSVDVVMGRLGGILGLADALSKGIGNAIMSAVLSPLLYDDLSMATVTNCTHTILTNNTHLLTEINYHGYQTTQSVSMADNVTSPCTGLTTSAERVYGIEVCGPNHCPYMEGHISVLKRPNQQLIYLLCGLFLACNLVGVATVFLLPNIKVQDRRPQTRRQRLLRTLSLFGNRRLYMLIASYLVVGYSNGCFGASFTQSFVSCTMGVGMVGYILMVEGFGRCASLLSGQLVKCIPRIIHTLFALGLVIFISLSWMFWHPSPAQKWLFFVMAVAAGIVIGVMRLHNRVLTARVFSESTEAGFAQSLLWDSLGRSVAFVSTSMLCMWIKALVLLCIGVSAIFTQIILEIDMYRNKEECVVQIQVPEENGIDPSLDRMLKPVTNGYATPFMPQNSEHSMLEK